MRQKKRQRQRISLFHFGLASRFDLLAYTHVCGVHSLGLLLSSFIALQAVQPAIDASDNETEEETKAAHISLLSHVATIQPTTHNPTTTTHNPHQSTTYNPQPTTQQLQPTTHNPQPTTYNSQHTTHNPKPTTHNPQPKPTATILTATALVEVIDCKELWR